LSTLDSQDPFTIFKFDFLDFIEVASKKLSVGNSNHKLISVNQPQTTTDIIILLVANLNRFDSSLWVELQPSPLITPYFPLCALSILEAEVHLE
jgi:hypothetical protein